MNHVHVSATGLFFAIIVAGFLSSCQEQMVRMDDRTLVVRYSNGNFKVCDIQEKQCNEYDEDFRRR